MTDRAPLTRPALPPTAGALLRRWWGMARDGTWRRAPAPWVSPLPDESREDEPQGRPARAPVSVVQTVGLFCVLTFCIGGAVVAGLWAFDQWQERASAQPIEVLIPQVAAIAPPTLSPVTAPAAASPSAVAEAPVIVHVAGAVNLPGLVTLVAGDRVADAIDAAGGVTVRADPDRVNLAAPLADGQRIYVLTVDESQPPSVAAASSGTAALRSSEGDGPAPSVDLNAATQADLEALPGVGPATAAAIIDHRNRRGNFFAADELMEVTGIGPAKYAALESLVHAGG